METLTQPSLLLKPFAEQGDKNTIPNVNTDPTEPQKADFTSGFPAIVSLPPDQGGLPPERKDFNALGYLTTLYDFFYQAGGTFTFDPTTSTAIGGYPLGARLWYTNDEGTSMILRSTIQNNTNNFLTDSSVIGTVGENKPWIIENFLGVRRETPLFSFNWFDHAPDDASWLRADTWSWQDGEVYISAYNMLEDQYTNGTQKSFNIGYYNVFGTPTVSNGVISGFSSTNYLTTIPAFCPKTDNWELNLKIRTHSASSSVAQDIFNSMLSSVDYGIHIQLNTSNKLALYLSSNGSSHDIASGTVCATTLSANTIYYLKMVFNGSSYVLYSSTTGDFSGEEVTEITITTSATLYSGMDTTYIGTNGNANYRNQPFLGTIDLKECNFSYDGVQIWSGALSVPYTEGPNGMRIVSSANAGIVQDLFEKEGVAWYYIIDTTNKRFKLPRTTFGFVGLRDAVGKYVEAGLPNITGSTDGYKVRTSNTSNSPAGHGTGALKYANDASKTGGTGTAAYDVSLTLDASQSNSIYGNSTTVQPPATQMYLYFFVGNSIRNETEVDVGQITEALNQKWDSSNMVVTTALPENPQTGVFYFIK